MCMCIIKTLHGRNWGECELAHVAQVLAIQSGSATQQSDSFTSIYCSKVHPYSTVDRAG